jgi:outer membrane protein assembly factor BamB
MALKCPEEIPVAPRSPNDTFGRVKTAWVRQQPGLWFSGSRPVVLGDLVIFAADLEPRLVALDKATGNLRWSTRVSSVESEPGIGIAGNDLVAGAGVVVAALSRNVVGVEIATGRELWSYTPPPEPLPDVRPGSVSFAELEADQTDAYIPASGPSISAVDLRTGRPRWIWAVRPGTSYPARANSVRLSGDTLYATVWPVGPLSDGWLLALDRRDGRELKRVAIAARPRGRPIVWRHLVMVSGERSQVWAFDRRSFELVWQYQPPRAEGTVVKAGAELYGDALYLDAGGAYIVALRAADGAIIWRTPITAIASNGLHATAERLYVLEGYTFLNILDRATGRYLVRTKKRGLTSGATSAGKQVFIAIYNAAWSFYEP